MSVVYEQNIEFNGTKLTVNPQFNETEVTRCKVNETDVIHKYNTTGLDMTAKIDITFYPWEDSSCDWSDSGIDMDVSLSFNGLNLQGITEVTLTSYRLEIKSNRSPSGSYRTDFSVAGPASPITSPTATFNNIVNSTTSNDDASHRYFFATISANFLLVTPDGNISVSFADDTLDELYYSGQVVTGTGKLWRRTQSLGDRVQEY